jgi:hypothetical protein
MPKRRKKAAQPDLATADMLMAQEDVAAMRPALAVAPELVVQTLSRKRRPRRPAKKKAKRRESASKKVRKRSPKTRKAKKAARRK